MMKRNECRANVLLLFFVLFLLEIPIRVSQLIVISCQILMFKVLPVTIDIIICVNRVSCELSLTKYCSISQRLSTMCCATSCQVVERTCTGERVESISSFPLSFYFLVASPHHLTNRVMVRVSLRYTTST